MGRQVACLLLLAAGLSLSGCSAVEGRVKAHSLWEMRGLYAVAVASDATSTAAARNNGRELNPLYEHTATQHLPQKVALSGLAVFPVCEAVALISGQNSGKACYFGALVPRFGAAVWNTAVWNKKKKP